MTETPAFLRGGGEAARKILARDWSGHPLGRPETWPDGLCTALSLVLNSPESMILAWGEELTFFFNDAYSPLLGPRLAWAMGERFDRVWADAWEQAEPIIDDAFAGRSRRFDDLPWRLDTDRGAADTWFTFSYSRILDRAGAIAGLFIFTNETTERVLSERRRGEAEAALRAERDRAHGVLDNMAEAFALLDRDLRILDLNAEALRLDARPGEGLIGRLHAEAYPDADPRIETAYRRALSEGRPVALEHSDPRPDGRARWIDRRACPVEGGLAVFYRDVTDRREDQERLRRSEALLAATLDALPVGVIIADIEGRVVRDNAANREIWGVPPETESWEGYADWVGYWPETGERIKAIEWGMSRALLNGETIRDELIECERFDGDGRRLFLNNAAPIRDVDGTIIGGVVAELDVTERIKDQRRLRASEALAQENADRVQLALAAGAIIGTWFWDLPTDRFTVDEAFARSFGLDPALGRVGLSLAQVVETVHPDDQAGLAAAIDAAIARGGSYAHQYRVRRADGNYYWLEANGRVDRAPDGTPLSFPGVLIDVDERRHIEAERDRTNALLLEKAAEFEVLADNIPILCWMAEAGGDLYWYNQRWYDYTGTDPESMRGWGWTSVHDPAVLPEVIARYRQSLTAGAPFEMTFPLRGRDGVFRPFLTRAMPIRDEAGEIVRWFGTNTDVAELEAAQAALRVLNETLGQQVAERTAERDQIWRATTDLLCVASFEGYFISLNPAWPNTLGWTEAEMKGRPFIDLVHPDDREATLAAATGLVRGEPQLTFENRYRHRDGSYRWLSWNAVPREGKIYASVRDVTAVKEQADALAEAEEALRQAQKMEAVGQLTGGVAHDFNNLLTIIRSSMDLLRKPNLPEERRARYMDAISDTVDRAAKLTGQLLAFARRQALTPEVFDVGARLDAVADMLDSVTGARIRVTTEGAAAACFVRADASQFETALVNLAVNARDAMAGEGLLTIRLASEVPLPGIRGHAGGAGPFVAVSVLDRGVGIAPENLARIFEPFFTTKEVGKGTGLGLSQVIGFAKQSGGDVDVQSDVGRGTTFTLYLPQVAAPAAEGRRDSAAESGGQERTLCVLVVEDNLDVGRFCTQILEDLGHSTVWAHNAESALAEMERIPFRFDAVFSDVVMPGMGGIELARRLRANHPDLPVILTSGYSDVLARDDAHGFELVRKPYSAEQVARAFSKIPGQERRRRKA